MAKPLAGEAIAKIPTICAGASMLVYRAVLPLSARTLAYTAGVIRRYRRQIGSAWRKLNPGQQALLALAYLRRGRHSPPWLPGSGWAQPRPGGM